MPKEQRAERLTVSLGEGQRDALQAIAQRNNATIAFVVRYALNEFIERHADGQLVLEFPGPEMTTNSSRFAQREANK